MYFLGNPFASGAAGDPFGMGAFNPNELDQQIQKVDKELMDLQVSSQQMV